MANQAVQFDYLPGTADLYFFPASEYGLSLADWTSYYQLAVERDPPNEGTYDVTLNDTYENWVGFEGSSQPATWWDAVLSLTLEAEESTPVEPDLEGLEELAEASKTIGPKMVKTKDVQISTHDPVRVQKAKNMTRSNKPVLFSDFPSTLASPKCEDFCTCKDDPDCV